MGQTSAISTRAHGGFSLIELTLVIAVMAIALVVVISNIDAVIPATRINTEGRRLATFIETAFSHSVATGKPVLVAFDINEQAYFMAFPTTDLDDDPYRMDHAQLNYMPESIRIVRVSKGDETSTSGIVTARVSPSGRINGHSVFIADKEDRKLTIEVLPLTGTASMFDGFVEPRDPDENSNEQK